MTPIICKEDRHCPEAEDIARRAVKDVFAILGVDIDKPESVEEFRKDLRFSQGLRKSADRGLAVAVGAVVLALVGALFAGMILKIGGKP